MPSFLISFPNPTDNIENFVVDRSSGENFIRQLLMIFDRIDCEGDTKIFINLKNKNQFIDDYKSLEHLLSLRIGAYTLEDTINQYIQTNTIKFLPEDVDGIDYHFSVDVGRQLLDPRAIKSNQIVSEN